MIAAQPAAALATVDLIPYGSGSYEYQSNPFHESGRGNLASIDDALSAVRAGIETRVSSPLQSLSAIAEVRRFDYQDLTFLTRNEELLDGAYDWTLTSRTNGTVEVRHEHRMVPFDELVEPRDLFMETEDLAAASLNLVSPSGWRLESRLRKRNLDSPRPGAPELSLRESAIHEALRRLGPAFSAGLDVEYLSGSFAGAAQRGTPRYSQTTLQLAGERKIPDFSTFEAALGLTTRDDSRGGSRSTYTGRLGYVREISGRTSIETHLERAVNSYISSTGSEIDTSLAVQMTWRPTGRIGVISGFAIVRSDLPGGANGTRRDRYRALTLEAHYQITDWVALHPYARHMLRASNAPDFDFSASTLGLEIVFKESR